MSRTPEGGLLQEDQRPYEVFVINWSQASQSARGNPQKTLSWVGMTCSVQVNAQHVHGRSTANLGLTDATLTRLSMRFRFLRRG